jgi:membrane complex biogenesis BtpA family protein
MIHVGALPGTPAGHEPLAQIVKRAAREAKVYQSAGIHGLMIENMHDTPYLKGGVGPEITAAMTAVARAVKAEANLPVGIQILAGANREALAVALAAGLDFIRAEGFAFAHVADEGLIESCAADLLRYRKEIGAEKVRVWADVKKKHSSHAITSDVGIGATAHAVEFLRGNAVIVTGSFTGDAASLHELEEVKNSVSLPVLLGSGVTTENLGDFFALADGFIVGTDFKKSRNWEKEPDPARIRAFMRRHRQLAGRRS